MSTSIFSALLRLYHDQLARFFVMRVLKEVGLSIYRGTYRLRCLVRRFPQTGAFRFISLTDSAKMSRSTIACFESDLIEIAPPTFTGYCAEIASQANAAIKIETPVLNVYEFSEATVVGGVEFIFVGDAAVHHDLFNPSQHKCPAENLGLVSIRRSEKVLELFLSRRAIRMERAVSLIGQCSGNYAHWLTETLPKLPVLDTCADFDEWPLLVDDGLHSNIYESLVTTNRKKREIIKIKRGQALILDRVGVVSSPGYERYAPHDVYSRDAPIYVNRFSRAGLRLLRDAVSEQIPSVILSTEKRVYLARSKESANIRSIVNAAEIDEVIRHYGIRSLSPESMTFKEQVDACFNAELIVAPVGASLANMIFAPPGCNIVILSPYYPGASFFYYSNLAGVLGHKLHYVLGKQITEHRHPIHRDYQVDPAAVADAIQNIVEAGSLKNGCRGAR